MPSIDPAVTSTTPITTDPPTRSQIPPKKQPTTTAAMSAATRGCRRTLRNPAETPRDSCTRAERRPLRLREEVLRRAATGTLTCRITRKPSLRAEEQPASSGAAPPPERRARPAPLARVLLGSLQQVAPKRRGGVSRVPRLRLPVTVKRGREHPRAATTRVRSPSSGRCRRVGREPPLHRRLRAIRGRRARRAERWRRSARVGLAGGIPGLVLSCRALVGGAP